MKPTAKQLMFAYEQGLRLTYAAEEKNLSACPGSFFNIKYNVCTVFVYDPESENNRTVYDLQTISISNSESIKKHVDEAILAIEKYNA